MPPTPTTEPTTGATPGTGATPAQGGQTPAPPPAGATPPAGTTATAAAIPPATGEEALGDAGRRILAEARAAAKDAEARAKAAEQERDALKATTLTDQEKAIAAARKEGETAADARWQSVVRRSEVMRVLTAAGISQSEIDLAAAAPAFGSLKLTERGEVEGLTDAVAAFKKDHPGLFATPAKPVPGGGQGPRPAAAPEDQIRAAEAAGDWRLAMSLKNRQVAELAAQKR